MVFKYRAKIPLEGRLAVEELLKKMEEYLVKKKKPYIKNVMKDLNLKEYEIIGLVEMLKQKGYLFDIVGEQIVQQRKGIDNNEVYQVPKVKNHYKWLFISDSHLCSKHDRVDILNYLYNEATKRGVDAVLHCGDITDGMYLNRPQQAYELRCQGFDNHLKYVVDKYPKTDEFKTYFIGGNHLDTYIRNGGSDMGRAISKERDDLVYLNPDTAKIMFGKTGILMHHGSGNQAYSLSYKLQKYVETIDDEDIYFIMQGHFHRALMMYYMNRYCYQVGALVDENNWSRSMGLKNEKSCYWIETNVDSKGKPIEVQQELETFGNKLIRKKY